MTRKDYELVSDVIQTLQRSADPTGQVPLSKVTGELAAAFSEDNPRFNHNKFVKACGFNPVKR